MNNPAVMTSTEKMHTLLGAAGIDAQAYMDQLGKHKTPITPEAFMARMESVFGENIHEKPEAALSLRAMHLESQSPVKTFNTLGQIETIRAEGSSALRKIGAGSSLLGNGRNLSKHYLGTGFFSALKNSAKLLVTFETDPSKSKFQWPKIRFGAPKGDKLAERSLAVAEDMLGNIQRQVSKGSGAEHIAAFFDLSEQSVAGIVNAAQNLLKDPQWRGRITAAIKDKQGTQALSKLGNREVYVALNEVLGAVGKIHNPADTKRIADAISILADEGKKAPPMELLTKYWKAAKQPLENVGNAIGTQAKALLGSVAEHNVAFSNRPSTNLGVAVASLGGAIFVGHHFAKGKEVTNESVDKNGTKTVETKVIPAGFWEKTSRFLGVTALLASCGVATFRAAAMPNKAGVSFVEKMLSGNAAATAKTL